MKKKLIITIGLVAVFFSISAQINEKAISISSGSGKIIIANFSSIYTIGELSMVTDISLAKDTSQNLLSTSDDLTSIKSSVIEIYPNPSTGLVNIKVDLKENEILHIQVYDILGKQVFADNLQSIISSGVQIKKINLNQLQNGLYFIEVIVTPLAGFSTKTTQKINLIK